MFENDNSKNFLTAGLIHNYNVANREANRAKNAKAYAADREEYVRELEGRSSRRRTAREIRIAFAQHIEERQHVGIAVIGLAIRASELDQAKLARPCDGRER
jgi:hypothetical protein